MLCFRLCYYFFLLKKTYSLLLRFLFIYSIDQTHKLYYGGVQKRPDGQYSRPVLTSDGKVMGQVSEATRKDVRNAVEAAGKAVAGYVVIMKLFCFLSFIS